MNGQQLYNLFVQILGDEAPDINYALTLFNIEKNVLELMRPWMVLKALDNSQTVSGATTYTTPIPMPTSPRFLRYLNEGAVQLFDGNDDLQVITQIPYEMVLAYKQSYGRFAADYANGQIYFMGLIPKIYTVYQYYIQATDPITLATAWQRFPIEFHPILAYQAAARWRLGTDYDDVNARNADDNMRMAQKIYDAMEKWDTERAIGSVNAIDYGSDRYPGIVAGRGDYNRPGTPNMPWY